MPSSRPERLPPGKNSREKNGWPLADLINLDDVRVLQLGDDLGFLVKAKAFIAAGMGRVEDHLEGDDPIELQVFGLVDDAHTAAAEFTEDLVTGHGQRFAARQGGAEVFTGQVSDGERVGRHEEPSGGEGGGTPASSVG